VKKFQKVCSVIALLTIGLFFLAGCSDSTSDDPGPGPRDPQGKGVLGQIHGIVVDSITFLPLADVEVELSITGEKTTTDSHGVYRFNDVEPGTHEISFTLDGYQYFRATDVTVEAGKYREDDPFGENDAWLGQIKALIASAGGGVVTTNDDAEGTEDSGIEVTINQISQGLYEIKTLKMNYDYSYIQKVELVELVPLKGKIAGEILLAKFSTDYLVKNTLDTADFVPIQDGVELWVKPSGAISEGGSIYGPFVTSGGGFSIEGIPAATGLKIEFNRFKQNDKYYSSVFLAQWDDEHGVFDETEFSLDAGYGSANYYALYLFPEDGFVTITNTDTSSRIALDGNLTVTFSEPIDANTVDFSITGNDDNIAAGLVPDLTALWSADGRTVTLSPDWNYPYSKNGQKKIGDLEISPVGGSHIRAKSGAIVYNNDLSLPIYTEEGLKLLAVDYNPSNPPPRYAIYTDAIAIKLTFNKAVSEYSQFDLEGDVVHWNLGSNATEVFIYTDRLTSTVSSEKNFGGKVISAADQSDTIDDLDLTTVLGANFEGFQKSPTPKLTLRSTSLWAAQPITQGNSSYQLVSASAAKPPVSLTFDRDPPEGVQVTATLGTFSTSNGGNTALAATWSGATLNLTPAARLTGTVSLTSLSITTVDSQPLFDLTELVRYGAAGPGKLININGSNQLTFSVNGSDPDAVTRTVRLTANTINSYHPIDNPVLTFSFSADRNGVAGTLTGHSVTFVGPNIIPDPSDTDPLNTGINKNYSTSLTGNVITVAFNNWTWLNSKDDNYYIKIQVSYDGVSNIAYTLADSVTNLGLVNLADSNTQRYYGNVLPPVLDPGPPIVYTTGGRTDMQGYYKFETPEYDAVQTLTLEQTSLWPLPLTSPPTPSNAILISRGEGAARATPIVFTFNEALDPVTVGVTKATIKGSLNVYDGTSTSIFDIPVTTSVDADTNTISIIPSVKLDSLTPYYVDDFEVSLYEAIDVDGVRTRGNKLGVIFDLEKDIHQYWRIVSWTRTDVSANPGVTPPIWDYQIDFETGPPASSGGGTGNAVAIDWISGFGGSQAGGSGSFSGTAVTATVVVNRQYYIHLDNDLGGSPQFGSLAWDTGTSDWSASGSGLRLVSNNVITVTPSGGGTPTKYPVNFRISRISANVIGFMVEANIGAVNSADSDFVNFSTTVEYVLGSGAPTTPPFVAGAGVPGINFNPPLNTPETLASDNPRLTFNLTVQKP